MASCQDARISTALPSHHKTKKLIKRLDKAGAWHLVCLFLWAASNRSEGDLAGMTDEDIELTVDWCGDAGALVGALVEVGFLDGESGSYRIHDWAQHNPWAAGAEARSEKSRWAALCKQHGRHEAARLMPEYAARLLDAANGMPDAVPDGASGTQQAGSGSAPSPFPSFPSPKEKSKTSALPTSLAEIPDWANAEAWAGFVDMRRKIRHPMTARAAELVLAELGKLRCDGHDPTAVLDQSTRNGWRDVFPIREQVKAKTGPAASLDAFAVAQ